jgi:hypothetical protein
MSADGIPPALLRQHPELAQIEEALADYHAGRPVTTRCPFCGELLEVTEIEATGSLWVRCPTGDTSMHIQRKPK